MPPHPPNPYPFEPSAEAFIQRLDAIDEITTIHPVWLQKHPDDDFSSIEELMPEIEAAYTQSPFSLESKSGTIRAIAKEHQELIATHNHHRLPTGLTDFSNPLTLTIFSNHIQSRIRVMLQILRLPIAICATIYFLTVFILWPSSLITNFTLFNFFIALYQWYTLFYDDSTFARAWLGYQSRVKAGLYYNSSDPIISKVLSKSQLIHQKYTAPFGLGGGDWATIFPVFLYDSMHHPVTDRYIPRWVATQGEAVLFDVAFPLNEQGKLYFDREKPVVVFLHGLNGSSRASYVIAAVDVYTKLGYTCICMNSRSYGGSFVLRMGFHGARIADVECILKIAHIGAGNGVSPQLASQTRKNKYGNSANGLEPNLPNFSNVFDPFCNPMDMELPFNTRNTLTPVIGVGYSMGGIVLSNSVATLGRFSGMTTAVTLCAMGKGVYNPHAMRDWEYALVADLKPVLKRSEHVLYYGGEGGKPLNIAHVAAASNLRQIDSEYSARVAGKGGDADAYYDAFSFCQDLPNGINRMDNLYTRLLVIHCADDPVLHVDILEPPVDRLVNKTAQNVCIYIPNQGGHVGLFNSYSDKWSYMTQLTLEFHQNALECIQEHDSKHKNYAQLLSEAKLQKFAPETSIAKKATD